MTEILKNEKAEKSEKKFKSERSEKSQKSQKSQKKDGSEKKEENKFIIPESMKSPNIPNENLSEFESDTDFIFLMQKLKQIISNKDMDWTKHLAVVNYLRRLFKYEKSIFNQLLYGLKIYPKIIELINSIRSVLAKNTLVLINEIFRENVPEFDEKKNKAPVIILIKAIIPTLITKANCNKSFIKSEAKLCLESLTNNMRYGDTLIFLIQSMNSKKNQEIDLSYNLAIKVINNLNKEYFGENNFFNELMKAISGIYELKKDIYVKKIIVIIKKISEKMTQNEFNTKLEKCPKKERELIKKALDPKNNKPMMKNSTSSDFQIFLKESKYKIKNKPIKMRNSSTASTTSIFVKNKTEISGKKK